MTQTPSDTQTKPDFDLSWDNFSEVDDSEPLPEAAPVPKACALDDAQCESCT